MSSNDSEKQAEESYWQLVEEIIELANKRAEELKPGVVSSALLQATSRYSAFYVAGSSESRKDLIEDKDDAIANISQEFKKQFASNLEDYIENYKVYLRSEEP